MKSLLSILAGMLLVAIHVDAQSIEREVVSSGGSVANGTGIQLSYTIGETAVTTQGTALIITQGFQQPNEQVEAQNSLNELNEYTLTLYPNPSQDEVRVMADANKDTKLLVYDERGKLILDQQVLLHAGEETSIAISSWSTGTYHFRFSDSNGDVEDFKVIKQ